MKHVSPATRFVLVLMTVEFLDELIGGVREAAWPLIRNDLGLTYIQIGLLHSLPGIAGNLVEPILGLLADAGKRKVLILSGGCVFVLSTILAASSQSFPALLLAYIFFYPASGAYVNLSQTVLMDLAPDRHEQNMSRWTFSGSLGLVMGPLLLSAAALGGMSWRFPLAGVALVAGTGLVFSWKAFTRYTHSLQSSQSSSGLRQGIRNSLIALRRPAVLRWLILLQFSELMLGVFGGFLALYMVDVAGLSPAAGGLAVAVWTGLGLLGDFLLIPLLERVPGIAYLRFSATIIVILFPAFLLTSGLEAKLLLLGLLGFLNAGWYAILKGRLYSAMPGQSGTALAVYSAFGLLHHLIPLTMGLVSQQFGLGTAMWLLLLGPVALLIGLPVKKNTLDHSTM